MKYTNSHNSTASNKAKSTGTLNAIDSSMINTKQKLIAEIERIQIKLAIAQNNQNTGLIDCYTVQLESLKAKLGANNE